VKQGDRVKVHYTGRHEDGTVFDSSDGKAPLEFTAGGPEVIPGVSKAVIGMEAGQKKTVTIPPAEGYGTHDDGLVSEVPVERLPDGAKVGDRLEARGGEQTFVVWVRELDDEKAKIDANHPLAGATLVFDLELVEIANAA
jgi:peptidylprolyl isomerase